MVEATTDVFDQMYESEAFIEAAGLPAGFAALQVFLEKGYTTFVALDDVDQFLDDITLRMTEVFTEIFTADL